MTATEAPREPTVFDYTKRYFRALKNHFRHGEYDAEGVQGWAHLDIRTNCLVSGATSYGLRAIQHRERYGTTHGLLGEFTKSRRREIVSAMNKDAYYVFPERLPESVIQALEAPMATEEGKLYPRLPDGTEYARYDAAKPVGPTYYYRSFSPTMQQWMADENLAALATEYLGVDPIIHTAQSWISAPFGTAPSAENAQLYHFDLSNLKMFKVFVYLTDVGPGNGPHCLIKGSHNPFDTTGSHLRRRGAVRIPDAEIDTLYPGREVEITGKRGTVFCVDTRSFHKGKYPTDGERRIVELYYVNSTFGIPSPTFEVKSPTPEYLAAARRWPRLFHYYPAVTP